MLNQQRDKKTIAMQTSADAVKTRKISFLLYTIVFLQGAVFFLLFFPFSGKSLVAFKSTGIEKEWRQCCQKGDKALQDGNHYQAIYFYEKALRVIPEKYRRQREKLNEKLSAIYDQISKKGQQAPALPADLAKTPYLLQQAEKQYHAEQYRLALPLFYQFLCQIDQNDNRKWLALVQFRIEQCKLLHGLKLGRTKQPLQQDQLLQYALETMKN